MAITNNNSHLAEGKTVCIVSPLLFYLYRIRNTVTRRSIRWLVLKIEGDDIYSKTIRRIFAVYHGVNVGMYSGSGCFVVNNFRPGTTIGRYSVIYPTAKAFNANHPMNTLSVHSLFYNPIHGFSDHDILKRSKLTIGNDVFIGHNAIILPSVSTIGDGVIIGAGSVVNKDIPPYAVVVGNPCKIVRFRYPDEKISEIMATKWWEKSFNELLPDISKFRVPLDGSGEIM